MFECFQSYDNGIKDFEFHNTFIAEINEPLASYSPLEEEVEALKFVTISEFYHLLDDSSSNHHFVESNRNYYETVLEAISNALAQSNP